MVKGCADPKVAVLDPVIKYYGQKMVEKESIYSLFQAPYNGTRWQLQSYAWSLYTLEFIRGLNSK